MHARRSTIALAVAVLLGSALAPAAQAQTFVNFDDLGPSLGSGAALPSPYKGFTWAVNNNPMGWTTQGGSFTDVVCRSGLNCAYNGFGRLSGITSTTSFTFSGWIRRWNLSSNTGGASSVLVEALNGSTVVSSLTLNLNANYQFFELLSPMTTLRFTPQGNNGFFLMDDVTFNPTVTPPDSNVVPEPSTYLLLATGLGMLAGVSKRRRRA